MESRQAFLSRAGAALLAGVFLFGAGCGPSKKELARRAEMERLEAEREAAARAARAEQEAAEEAERAARERRLSELESQGDADAAAGRFERALSSYRLLLQEHVAGTEADIRIREKILKAPGAAAWPVPEEARRHAVRAQALVKAREAAGYAPAVEELRQAVALAPWWADAYYNKGLMEEGAGNYAEAMRSFRMYLAGAPEGENAQEVQNKIYELEVLQEEAEKLSGLAGTWHIYFKSTRKRGDVRYEVAMNGDAFSAKSSFGHVLRGTVRGRDIDGTITMPSFKGWDINDCRTPEYTVPLTGKIRDDGRLITFSHMWNNYTSTHWNITGLFNTTGHYQGECIAVKLEGVSPNEFSIAR